MSDTDTALVRRARDGDRPAFEELVRRSSRLVFARLYLETGSVHRAEDLLQDTLLRPFYDSLQYGWVVPQHPQYGKIRNKVIDVGSLVEHRREELPDVDHAFPRLVDDVDAGLARALGEARRVVEQQ